MDYPTYKQLRTYCWQDLAAYLDTPNNNLAVELAGGSERAEIEYECRFAQKFWYDCKDLTPREHAAARLLAAISNHWLRVWEREPNPPDGLEPAPPLENWRVVELEAQTAKAVRDYALAVPEHADAVLAAVEQSAPAALAEVQTQLINEIRKAADIEKEPKDTQPETSASEQAANNRKNYDLTGKRGCGRLILENWDDIEKLHGTNVDGRKVLNLLKRRVDASELPKLKAIQNRLSLLRNEKLIP